MKIDRYDALAYDNNYGYLNWLFQSAYCPRRSTGGVGRHYVFSCINLSFIFCKICRMHYLEKFILHYIFCCKFVNFSYLSLPQTSFQRDTPSFSEITSPIPNISRRKNNISFLLNLHKSTKLTYCYFYWELCRKIADGFLMWSFPRCMRIWPEFT